MALHGNVLIVEDEPGPALALKMILKPYHRVYSAERGETAIEILESLQAQGDPVDVVTLDLRMPGLCGMPLLERIKALDEDVEVIVITGYGDLKTAMASINLKVFSYVAKPFDVIEILDKTKQAIQKRRRLQQMRTAKEDFFANLTHEFRTPLAAIMGFSDILLDGHASNLTLVQREALGRIRENSECLRSYIDDIFYLADVENGKRSFAATAFDARSMLEDLTLRHTTAFAEKGLTLELGALPTLPVRTDEEMLSKVVNALVENAFKFTAAGTVRIDAGLLPDGTLEIRVRDSGIGMRSQQVAELLEGFRWAEPTARKQTRGIGLGMRLVMRLINAIGGRLTVSSALACGSEFTVYVPPLLETVLEQSGSRTVPTTLPVARPHVKQQASA